MLVSFCYLHNIVRSLFKEVSNLVGIFSGEFYRHISQLVIYSLAIFPLILSAFTNNQSNVAK